MANKYHWIKLPDNFFKRHDIKIIKKMENGEKYVLFYQQLLLESISHEGELRFSDMIPYDENMLSTITDTDIDIVRSAMKLLTQLGMVEILDDATIYMAELQKMVGTDNGAERVRRHREKKKIELLEDVTKCNVTETLPSISISNSISNSKYISIKAKKEKVFIPPTYQEVLEYAESRHREDIAKKFWDWYEVGKWLDKDGKHIQIWKQKFIGWESRNPAPIRPQSAKHFEEVEEPKDLPSEEERAKLVEETRERLKGMF